MNVNFREEDFLHELIYNKDSFKTTSKARHTPTGKLYFFKKEEFQPGEINEIRLVREMCSSLTMSNKRIVHHFEVIEKPNYMIFLSEFSEKGSLEAEIATRLNQSTKWADEELWNIWSFLLQGFQFMEFQYCSHRNIQPKNLIKFSDTEYKITNFHCAQDRLNLCDFKSFTEHRFRATIRQSFRIQNNIEFLSPEVRRSFALPDAGLFNPFKSDVYSLGLVFMKMSELSMPKELKSIEDLERNTNQIISKLDRCQKIKNLLSDMLKTENSTRPQFKDLLRVHFPDKFITEPLPIPKFPINFNIKPPNFEEVKLSYHKSLSSFKPKIDASSSEQSKLIPSTKVIVASPVKKESNLLTNKLDLKEECKIDENNIRSVIQLSSNCDPMDNSILKLAYNSYADTRSNPIINEKVVKSKEKKSEILLSPKIDTGIHDIEVLPQDPLPKILTFADVRLNECIQNGSSDRNVSIYKCQLIPYNINAVAKIYLLTPETQHTAEYEKNLYERLSYHASFPKFFGSFTANSSLYIIIEYVPKTLTSYIKSEEIYDEVTYKAFIKKLLEGFIVLEKLNICHCDIKPQNILVTQGNLPKIIDFGSARPYTDPTIVIPVRGTNNYLAPEIAGDGSRLDEKDYDCAYDIAKADAFSLGLTLLEFVLKTETKMINLTFKKKKLEREIKNIEYDWAEDLVECLIIDRISMVEAYKSFSLVCPASLQSRSQH